MAKNDLIIGGVYNYGINQLKPWVLSIEENVPDAHRVMCVSDISKETKDWLIEKGFELVDIPQINLPVHMARFLAIYDYLKKNWSKYRYVVTTDVKDVFFQKDPFEWLEMNNIGSDRRLVAPSESMYYKDEPWNSDNMKQAYGNYFYEEFKNLVIYCVGVIGGTSEYVKDLVFNIFTNGINRPIPIVDQVVFNMLIQTQPYKDITHFAKQA